MTVLDLQSGDSPDPNEREGPGGSTSGLAALALFIVLSLVVISVWLRRQA